MDWLLGEPPAIIAANRWDFSRYTPTGEFGDFVIMQEYHQVLQRCPALLAPPPPLSQTKKKRGRPPSLISPRALLDAILWKLATGHNWDELPLGFPPVRRCQKYYRRLFLSGRFYTLMLALYNHMRLEGLVDLYELLEQDFFTTTPSQNIALCPKVPPTWQNYTALLFMQLGRDAYLRREREKKSPFYATVLRGNLPSPQAYCPPTKNRLLRPPLNRSKKVWPEETGSKTKKTRKGSAKLLLANSRWERQPMKKQPHRRLLKKRLRPPRMMNDATFPAGTGWFKI